MASSNVSTTIVGDYGTLFNGFPAGSGKANGYPFKTGKQTGPIKKKVGKSPYPNGTSKKSK